MLAFVFRILLAALSGAVAYTSYEPLGWWTAGIIAASLFYFVLMPWPGSASRENPGRYPSRIPQATSHRSQRPSMAQGALFGFVHAMACYLLLLPWIGEFVGSPPYIALAVVCSLYAILTGLGGVALARSTWGFLAFPFWYLAIEFARSSFPFGGFAWVRLAWGQVAGPLAGLAQWGGPALVTVATLFIGVGVTQLTFSARLRTSPSRTTWLRTVSVAMVIVPLFSGAIATFNLHRPENTFAEIKVAAVQGNVPRLGLDFAAQRSAVLHNHVRETKKLAEQTEQLDLVIWPENSSDVNPFSDREAYEAITSAVSAVGTPVVVGTITHREGRPYNTMQTFLPEYDQSPEETRADSSEPTRTHQVQGMRPGEFHDKVYLQPFGETLPMRGFFEKLSEYAEMAGNFAPGDGNGVLQIPTGGADITTDHGDVAVGVATCYEVAFDEAFRRSINNGASILTSPTNNATFGFTDMTYQQLAMSRMRAIETDRAMVVPATSGVSALVDPAGNVLADTEIFEANHLVATLPLRSGITPAVRVGQMLELAMVLMGVVLGILAVIRRRVKE
ncbi:apolipoprotein N-acyltransferase [Corynebacterium pseudodiphtheriticum]|uniref:apolipoprotein N-acyltransferase n=1 Tax=Corynebacterium pseudodiphtheriticum TaxID=37637 RepID=UPI0025431701|nr:apolipoprotein N-acyltransferase [Corynebacterium pseudodiphtheriticum]MDK4250292.1 apolipoprotein N-acyltransferase [Corynebacterium pseudodiphtheriticum]MDK4288381.1 apolipoprotein N-acyltransferase [Corynebacterium pseudodiphtheriticum]